ncbi:hypothetical protein STXM2123_1091 [Streptomyces sp. F-3]|nr:hypothetical protein STXM2123_1091 [Streptomyces sp. F-3]
MDVGQDDVHRVGEVGVEVAMAVPDRLGPVEDFRPGLTAVSRPR